MIWAKSGTLAGVLQPQPGAEHSMGSGGAMFAGGMGGRGFLLN